MHIKTDGLIEKAAKLSEGEVEFVVSTNALDSYGERINVDGIATKDFMKNPVVLWGHDSFNLPIAKATKVWKDGNKLMARAKFYLKDDFPRKVYNYIVDGYLNAVSIGGKVEEWGDDGITIKKMNMKEFSVVSVPANPEALLTAKSLSDNEMSDLRAAANMYARKTILSQDELQRDIQALKTLVASLEEVALETKEGTATNHTVVRLAQSVDHQVEKIITKVKYKGE